MSAPSRLPQARRAHHVRTSRRRQDATVAWIGISEPNYGLQRGRRRADARRPPSRTMKSWCSLRPPLRDGEPHDGVGQDEVGEGQDEQPAVHQPSRRLRLRSSFSASGVAATSLRRLSTTRICSAVNRRSAASAVNSSSSSAPAVASIRSRQPSRARPPRLSAPPSQD